MTDDRLRAIEDQLERFVSDIESEKRSRVTTANQINELNERSKTNCQLLTEVHSEVLGLKDGEWFTLKQKVLLIWNIPKALILVLLSCIGTLAVQWLLKTLHLLQ